MSKPEKRPLRGFAGRLMFDFGLALDRPGFMCAARTSDATESDQFNKFPFEPDTDAVAQ